MQNNLRQRRFLLVLPLLIIPFVSLAFYALGGGSGTGSSVIVPLPKGLNLELPGANFNNEKITDKLGYYEKAEQDSARIKKLMADDPYFDQPMQFPGEESLGDEGGAEETLPTPRRIRSVSGYVDPNERKVYQKLEELNRVMQSSAVPVLNPGEFAVERSTPSIGSEEVDRLESMMQLMKNDRPEGDPELNQINGMLEKILDVQHPERVNQRLKENREINQEAVYKVEAEPENKNISLIDTIAEQKTGKGFFGLDGDFMEDIPNTAIEAVVHETQTLVNGSVVKMRLEQDFYLGEQLIPADNFVYGEAELKDERLTITITSIRKDNYLFPVKMEVYDMDGLPGIHIPGAITRDVAKQSAASSLQTIGNVSAIDPSFGAQAASAGVETVKTLLSKKVKLVKVQVKAGHRILLQQIN